MFLSVTRLFVNGLTKNRLILKHNLFMTFSTQMAARNRRLLTLHNYDAFGFDIDHTLAKYKLNNLFQDSYDAMAKYLVNKKGYGKEAFHFDKDFCMRGLVLDLDKGNFMKLAEDGRVLRASHGTRPIKEAEMEKLFGASQHWEHFEELIQNVNNIGERYRIFENFFDMPTGVLCAHAVDYLDIKAGHHLEHYDYWPDVMDAINHVYHPDQFEANEGDFFPKWKKKTNLYVYECSKHVKDWLKSLKKENKKLFVLTSSNEDFARASLQFILGDDWQSYFDLYMSLAKKPNFFKSNRNFTWLSNSGPAEKPVTELEEGGFYLEGNSKVLSEHLAKVIGKDNPKVLFFGDSLRSDIFPSKIFGGWDTVLVLEEMESEKLLLEESEEPLYKKLKTEIQTGVHHECLTSTMWGSLFTDDHVCGQFYQSEMNTLWGYIIRKYADIAIPSLDYIADFSKNHGFETFDHNDPQVWGFHPRIPKSLQEKLKNGDLRENKNSTN